MRQHIEALGGADSQRNNDDGNFGGALFKRNESSANLASKKRNDAVIEDLEDTMPGAIPTISNRVSNHMGLANGHIGGKEPSQTNGHIPNGRPNFRTMLEDVELDSHI